VLFVGDVCRGGDRYVPPQYPDDDLFSKALLSAGCAIDAPMSGLKARE
jgi:hypothetical protein